MHAYAYARTRLCVRKCINLRHLFRFARGCSPIWRFQTEKRSSFITGRIPRGKFSHFAMPVSGMITKSYDNFKPEPVKWNWKKFLYFHYSPLFTFHFVLLLEAIEKSAKKTLVESKESNDNLLPRHFPSSSFLPTHLLIPFNTSRLGNFFFFKESLLTGV